MTAASRRSPRVVVQFGSSVSLEADGSTHPNDPGDATDQITLDEQDDSHR